MPTFLLSLTPVFSLCCCRHSDVSESLFLWQCVWAPGSSRWMLVTSFVYFSQSLIATAVRPPLIPFSCHQCIRAYVRTHSSSFAWLRFCFGWNVRHGNPSSCSWRVQLSPAVIILVNVSGVVMVFHRSWRVSFGKRGNMVDSIVCRTNLCAFIRIWPHVKASASLCTQRSAVLQIRGSWWRFLQSTSSCSDCGKQNVPRCIRFRSSLWDLHRCCDESPNKASFGFQPPHPNLQQMEHFSFPKLSGSRDGFSLQNIVAVIYWPKNHGNFCWPDTMIQL